MRGYKTYNRKKIVVVFICCTLAMTGLGGRLTYLMIYQGEYYTERAEELHERERTIKAARGKIIDSTGAVLATNRTVCTISVIHSQIEKPKEVISMLVKELGISEETARKKVEKVSSIEKIKSNVSKEIGDKISYIDVESLFRQLSKVLYKEMYAEGKEKEFDDDFTNRKRSVVKIEDCLSINEVVLTSFDKNISIRTTI